jgi:response regulator NasT
MSAGSVLIVCGKAEVARSMEAMLVREGFYPVSYAHSANEARRTFFYTQPDLIIISTPLPDELGTDLIFDVHEKTSAGIVVIARPDQLIDMQEDLEETGALILPKPINALTLRQSARFALSVRNSMSQLKNERDDLKKRMDERKAIEQAKWLLVENKKLSEPEALHFIQRRAMDLRIPQVQVAKEILNEYE